MKKILLVAFLMLFVGVNAQFNKQYKDLTKTQFDDFAKEIISTTGKEYVLSKEVKKDNFIDYHYINKNDKSDELIISTYTLLLDVTNTSKGWTSWTVQKMYGKYETLFSLWNKYVDINADFQNIFINEITQSHGDKVVKFIHRKNAKEDFWFIRI